MGGNGSALRPAQTPITPASKTLASTTSRQASHPGSFKASEDFEINISQDSCLLDGGNN
jgi:hypothetical protein